MSGRFRKKQVPAVDRKRKAGTGDRKVRVRDVSWEWMADESHLCVEF